MVLFSCLLISCRYIFSGCLLESLSEAVKILKVEYLVTAINAHRMDQAIIFCRTKLDCDNVEQYLISLGGGEIKRNRTLKIKQVLVIVT